MRKWFKRKWNKFKKWVSEKYDEFKESRFLLGCVSLVIGMSLMICLYEGKSLYQDYTKAMGYWEVYCNREVASATSPDTSLENGEGFEPAVSSEEGEFSAYNSDVNQCAGDPTIMASGKTVYVGAIACPARFEFGTQIEVEGMGVYVCEDRMNIRYRETNHFDLFMENYTEAIAFGRKQLSFKVI